MSTKKPAPNKKPSSPNPEQDFSAFLQAARDALAEEEKLKTSLKNLTEDVNTHRAECPHPYTCPGLQLGYQMRAKILQRLAQLGQVWN